MDQDPAPSLDTLKRFFEKKRGSRAADRCDLCDVELAAEHGHLVNVSTRALMCACRACYLLFANAGAGGARYRAVPDRYVSLDRNLDWDGLQIPVGVAFFFFNSALARVAAFYPSPAGATESLLPLDTWADIVSACPPIAQLAPDVEALLVRRTHDRRESFIVPIDACYELVGAIRRLWRGFDGGDEARDEIDRFFARVRARSRPLQAAELA
jgi:Family of unknown function (DUF5947)